MPPQQAHGLLDRFDELLGFGAHGGWISRNRRRDSRGVERGRKLGRSPCEVNLPPGEAPARRAHSPRRLLAATTAFGQEFGFIDQMKPLPFTCVCSLGKMLILQFRVYLSKKSD